MGRLGSGAGRGSVRFGWVIRSTLRVYHSLTDSTAPYPTQSLQTMFVVPNEADECNAVFIDSAAVRGERSPLLLKGDMTLEKFLALPETTSEDGVSFAELPDSVELVDVQGFDGEVVA